MGDAAAFEIMSRFGKAFFGKDPLLLAGAITEDAEWHRDSGPDAPHGRVFRGGGLQGIAVKDVLNENQRFNDGVIRALGEDSIVMPYLLSGKRRGGPESSLRGVELITVWDSRICRKDVFHKQMTAAWTVRKGCFSRGARACP